MLRRPASITCCSSDWLYPALPLEATGSNAKQRSLATCFSLFGRELLLGAICLGAGHCRVTRLNSAAGSWSDSGLVLNNQHGSNLVGKVTKNLVFVSWYMFFSISMATVRTLTQPYVNWFGRSNYGRSNYFWSLRLWLEQGNCYGLWWYHQLTYYDQPARIVYCRALGGLGDLPRANLNRLDLPTRFHSKK